MHHHSCWTHSDTRHAARAARRGFRGVGRAFGQFGDVGGGFPFGKFVGDGELRLIVLALLAGGPRHGYDLIKDLEERSSGFYSPSPGVIYPTLTYLEEAGHAGSMAEGNKKVYSISDAGRAHLAANQEAADAMLARIAWVGKRLSQARHWFERGAGEADVGDRAMHDVAPELNEARRALKRALWEKRGSSPEEQRRVADLLLRAAKEIRGSSDADGPDEIDL